MSQGFTQPLPIPLPVNKGGTGVVTSTGTGAVVLGTTPTINQPNLGGVTTVSNATAGSVGEYLSTIVLIGSAISLTTAVSTNIATLSVTAGDWDIWGEIWYDGSAGTILIRAYQAITTVSATISFTVPSNDYSQSCFHGSVSAVGSVGAPIWPIPATRINVASTTDVFMVVRADYTTPTLTAYGKICARRRR